MKISKAIKRVAKKIIKKYFILLLSILLFLLTVMVSASGIENDSIIHDDSEIYSEISITEIMFNPEGSDTGREWIELYIDCDADVNISNYRLNESNVKHNIYAYNNISSCGYAIICSNCETFYTEHYLENSNISLLKSSFSLSNTGEYLSILKDDKIIFETDYAGVIAQEGRSIMLVNNTWIESIFGGTPGYFIDNLDNESIIEENIIENVTETNYTNNETEHTYNETNYNETEQNYTDIDYTEIDYNNTEPEYNNTETSSNETENNTTEINKTIKLDHAVPECRINLSIEIVDEKEYYEQGSKIAFYNRMLLINYSDEISYNIEYWIEDLFGNMIKNKVMTSNLNQKTYTAKVDEADKVLIIKNRLVNVSCNISNDSMIEYSKILIIKNDDYEPEECSQTTNDATSDNAEETESTVDVIIKDSGKNYEITAEIYRGNTRKSVMDIYLKNDLEKVVEKYHTKINNQYCSAELVWIVNKEELACNKEYTLIFEGLELLEYKSLIKECTIEEINTINTDIKKTATEKVSEKEKSEIKIESITKENYGNELSIINSDTIDNIIEKNDTLNTYNHTNQITGESIYESDNQKNRRYSLIGILIMVIIGVVITGIFLWKKYLKKV